MAITEELLRLSHITKGFAGVRALQDVTLSIGKGEICCLVGENGSGKSTLIKIIAGMHAPDSGEIVISGKAHATLSPIDAIREGIEVIYQDFSLFPNLTVAENLALNEEISSNRRFVSWREVTRIARQALSRISVDLDLNRLVSGLSVADRQLVAIARALLKNARLIIMDEPTSALTQTEVGALFSVIQNLKATGIAILFVSHKLDEVQEIAERTIVLRNGVKVVDAEARTLDRASIVRHMVGHDIAAGGARGRVGPEAPVVLKVDRLSCGRYFTDVSLELRAGEILGITGLRGSGRSSLALSLFGMLPAESGAVFVDGRRVRLRSVQDALACGVGYLPEDRLNEGLFPRQSIGKNLVVRVIDSLLRRGPLVDQSAVDAVITEWLDRLSIRTPSPDLPVTSLSGGNQQRVVLARWLAAEPKILMLNGPTIGVDVGSKAEIHEIVRRLAGRGMGLIVISDDVPELLQVCHRVALMKKGRVVEEYLREDLTEARLNAVLRTA
jgi:simple sugar transport system ATP-binding protein